MAESYKGAPLAKRRGLLDANTILKASGAAVTASADYDAVSVGTGYLECDLIIDISAITTGADLSYTFKLQGSNDSGSTWVDVAQYVASATGRRIIPATNDVLGTKYASLRLTLTVVKDTSSPSITFMAYLTKKVH